MSTHHATALSPLPAQPVAPPPGRRVITQAEWYEEGKRRFGGDPRQWQFVCPSCKTVQTIQELKDLGLSSEEIHGVMAYSCIGRFTRRKGCDWTLGGLLQIHTLEVITADGHRRPTFEFAEVGETDLKSQISNGGQGGRA